MTVLDLTTLSAREVDELWANEIRKLDSVRRRLVENRRKAGRYAKFSQEAPDYITDRIERDQVMIDEAIAPFWAEWDRRGGWTRYFLVVSSAKGHIHRPGHCSSYRYGSTQICPLPELTEVSEAEAIERMGAKLCTKCFPAAPVADAPTAAEGYCTGQGKYATEGSVNWRAYSPTGACPDCGKRMGVSKTGKIRRHKS